MFSGSATSYGAPTNTQVAYFDAALPGTLPVRYIFYLFILAISGTKF